MYYFTADEHYGHKNIIEYCHRPYDSVEEMNEEIIRRHNLMVTGKDTVVHVGDFAWGKSWPDDIISRLNGSHIFIEGSHDKWFLHTNSKKYETLSDRIWEKTIDGQHVVACHYAMLRWPRSHYGAWHVFGHSHGSLVGVDLSYDVGVDNNDFYPVGFDVLKRLMVEHAEAILDEGGRVLLGCYEQALEKLVGY